MSDVLLTGESTAAVRLVDHEGPLDDRFESTRREAVHAAITLFGALVALGIAGLGYLARLGFSDNSLVLWGKFVALSWFLLFFSSLARTLPAVRNVQGSGRVWTGHAGLSLAALILAALLGMGSGWETFARGAAWAVFALGAAGFLLAGRRAVRLLCLRELAAVVIFACVFAVYAACACSANGYQNPLFVEGICFNYCQIDELFHASMSNMLRTYGVPSTGLDGLPFIPYHFGSHWLFARLCNLLDVRVIDFYTRGYRIVFVPFGVYSLGILAATLARRMRRAPGGLFWLIVLTAYVSFMPYPPFGTPIYAWASIIVSESYALAVAVSLLSLAWGWTFFESVRLRGCRWSTEVVIGGLVIAGLMAAISLLKISQAVVLGAAVAFFFVRLAWYRSAVLTYLTASAAAGALCVLGLSLNPHLGHATSVFLPFGFVRACVEPELWPYFWLFYYAWLWLFAAVRLREEKVGTCRALGRAVRGKKLLDLEFLFVAAIAGGVPGMLFIPYSGAHFFAEYQQWLALALLLALLIGRRRGQDTGASTDRPWLGRILGWRELAVSRVFLAAVMLSVAGMALSNTLRLAAQWVNEDAVSRGHAGGGMGINAALRQGRFREADALLTETATEVEQHLASDKNVLGLLRSLDAMPLAEKRVSLLFIPKSNRQFWQLLHGSYWPLDGPLVAPALSGIAMIDGLCDRSPGSQMIWYGYDHYPLPDPGRRQPPLQQYLPQLKSRCAKMGFKQLIVIDMDADGRAREKRYDCSGAASP